MQTIQLGLDFNTLAEEQDFIQKLRALLPTRYNRTPLAHIHSYGCQANLSDSEKLAGIAIKMGYAITENMTMADLIIFNTCAVRETAQSRVYGHIGELSHLKQENPDLIIAICGCMTQQEIVADKIKHSYPHVDIVFGTGGAHLLPQMLYQRLQGAGRIFNSGQALYDIVENMPIHREGSYKASVPIMYGCNNFCSYCIVPYVRGRERSRKATHILTEIATLVQQGYKEITLLGQNVNSYHSDGVDFPTLLRQIQAIEGDFWVRFMTSHPKDCTKVLIDAIAACPKVCRHIHLPVQAGSQEVLAQMNRGYTPTHYKALTAYAREIIPEISFTSDIIVGFPGETPAQFAKTLQLVQEMRFTALFTFIYSKRQGTKAASLADPAPHKEKTTHMRQLLDAQDAISLEINRSFVGKTLQVLAEGQVGRTEHNLLVRFGQGATEGEFIQVKITRASNKMLFGEIIK